MGGGGGKSKPKVVTYKAPAVPETPETVEQEESGAVAAAADKARKAAALAAGRSSTILTGALGDTSEAAVSRKTLLGQ